MVGDLVGACVGGVVIIREMPLSTSLQLDGGSAASCGGRGVVNVHGVAAPRCELCVSNGAEGKTRL